MKGLLYKDCSLLWKQGKMYLLIILIFSAIPQMSRSGLAIAYASILPYTAIAYDEQTKWGRLATMLPYSDLQLVLCKYVLAWLGLLLVTIVSSFARTADLLIKGQAAMLAGEYQEVILYAAICSLASAVVLPLSFRYGVERGRMAFVLVVILCTVGIVILSEALLPRLNAIPAWLMVLAILLLAAAINTASVSFSRKWYRRGLRA